MRINRVTMAGFGPYRGEQTVDFDAFADDGIFLIGGKTGAGKSSILDAICYALYNSVPRYDETESRLRSDHCGPDDPTLVTLDFTVGERRYRIERSPDYERPKKRGVGTTTAAAQARLAIWQHDQWVGVQSGPRDVGLALDELLRLKKDQFLQVILLAQNRFQQFLLAKNDDRQKLLRTLFGTVRFKEYEESLLAKRASLEKDVEFSRQKTRQFLAQATPLLGDAVRAGAGAADADVQIGAAETDRGIAEPSVVGTERTAARRAHADAAGDVGAALAVADERLAALGTAVADAAGRASETDSRYRSARSEHDTRTTTHERQLRRQRAADARSQLDEAAPAIDADRRALQLAARADAVWPFVTGRRKAANELADALAVESEARATYASVRDADAAEANAAAAAETEADRAARLTIETVTAELDRLGKLLGSLDSAVEQERELPQLSAAAEAALEERHTASARVDEHLARQNELPTLLTDGRGRLAAAQLLAAKKAESQANLERLTTARAAASKAMRLAEQVRDAEENELVAGEARTRASAEVDELRQRRLHGYAGELAAQLVDGEPCAVCGSIAHPQPATSEGKPVTEADIEAAEDARTAADNAAAQATAALNALRVKFGEQHAKAGERGIDELDALIPGAETSVSEAQNAAADATSIGAELEKLQAEAHAIDEALAAARAQRDAASATCVQAQTTLEAAEQITAKHRGDYDTVAARVVAVGGQAAIAQSLVRALSVSEQRRRALASAEEACAEQLSAQDFATEEAASDARMPSAAQAEASDRIRLHDDALAAATAVLAEPELQGIADDLLDVEESARALAEVESERDAARAFHDRLMTTEKQASWLVAQARDAHEATSAAAERYEVVRRLAATLHGETPNTKRMKLEAYVLAAQLEEIVEAANGRLRQMSGGRYLLEHSDALSYRNAQSGLGVTILDLHTGRSRSTNSLSGGETFLASLALALGLAEVVTSRAGGITLDTLFIDEGFGSLDSETLEIAMATLDSLRTGGRTVGLISHVETMKEQIPAKLAIDVADGGWSVIRQ